MTIQITVILLIISIILRVVFNQLESMKTYNKDSMAQTTGNREIQADIMDISVTQAGKLAVIADGIGKENTGRICAKLAVSEFMKAFSMYKKLDNPEYFFERTMYSAHMNIQKALEERHGGASVGAAFLSAGKLYYGLVGQIKIALLRNGELIILSEGQTIDVLAQRAYTDGKLDRQETIWSMQNHKITNYAGMDGFCRMEICEVPIDLKKGDLVILMTKGIYEEVSYFELEKILSSSSYTAAEKTKQIVYQAEKSEAEDKENGSIMLLLMDGVLG